MKVMTAIAAIVDSNAHKDIRHLLDTEPTLVLGRGGITQNAVLPTERRGTTLPQWARTREPLLLPDGLCTSANHLAPARRFEGAKCTGSSGVQFAPTSLITSINRIQVRSLVNFFS